MNKQNLFSIGQITKQTGVNFNSLRYYEQLGILTPAYVDPQNGYRYYAFSQIRIVEAIQLCVELGIPLSQFEHYLKNDGKSINYAKLIEHGAVLAEEKIKAIENKLNMLVEIKNEINHAEQCYSTPTPQKFFLPEKVIWTTPYCGNQIGDNFTSIFKKTMLEINRLSLRVGYDYGLIMFCSTEETKQYFYIDLELLPEQIDSYKNIIYLPASDYLCLSRKSSGIEKAPDYFPDFFERNSNKIVIETELFTGDFCFHQPIYEVRCLLPGE